MPSEKEIMMDMKSVFGYESFCKCCLKTCYLRCYRCEMIYCSLACMILDNHEHAPGANEWDDAMKLRKGLFQLQGKPFNIKNATDTLAYKVMKDKLPENVKKGSHKSVQARLQKALEKSVEPAGAPTKGDSKDLAAVGGKHDCNSTAKDPLLEKIQSRLSKDMKEEEQRKAWKMFMESREMELALFDDHMRKASN